MLKEFNTTGTCYAEDHYLMDNSAKLTAILALIERGKYFIINRPRQYGKTTTLFNLVDRLNEREEYQPIKLNFQGIDNKWLQSDELFAQVFMLKIEEALKYTSPQLFDFLQERKARISKYGHFVCIDY